MFGESCGEKNGMRAKRERIKLSKTTGLVIILLVSLVFNGA